MRADLKGVVRAARNDGADRMRDIGTRLKETARDWEERAAKQLHDAYESARERGQQAVQKGRDKVTERPLTSVLLAFLGGAILTKLFWRR